MVKQKNSTERQSKMTSFVTKTTFESDLINSTQTPVPPKKIKINEEVINLKKSMKVSGYLTNLNDVLMNNSSQLIYIEPVDANGCSILWLYVNKSLMKVSVAIPKLFFVDFESKENLSSELIQNLKQNIDENISCSKSSKLLPLGKFPTNLYKICIHSEKYNENME